MSAGNISVIVENALVEIKSARDVSMLNAIQTKYIGTNGLLTRSIKSAAQLPSQFREVRIRAIEDAIRNVNRKIEGKRKSIK